jgi:hypothetical protein
MEFETFELSTRPGSNIALDQEIIHVPTGMVELS